MTGWWRAFTPLAWGAVLVMAVVLALWLSDPFGLGRRRSEQQARQAEQTRQSEQARKAEREGQAVLDQRRSETQQRLEQITIETGKAIGETRGDEKGRTALDENSRDRLLRHDDSLCRATGGAHCAARAGAAGRGVSAVSDRDPA